MQPEEWITLNAQLSAGADSLRATKDRISGEIGGMVTEATDLVKNIGTQKLDSARTSIAHAQAIVTDSAKQYASVTDQYVRANPWKALGVAAAGGLLVGILLARR